MNTISQKLHLIFAVHPRTRNSLDKFNLYNKLNDNNNITLIAPISYVPFMSLVRSAKAVITDSGGIQEETTYLDIPCLTLRKILNALSQLLKVQINWSQPKIYQST